MFSRANVNKTTPSESAEPDKAAAGVWPESVTPRMDEADLHEAGLLSLQQSRPPAKVSGYEQEQFLGRGAFGEVWKAVDSNSGRAVAIKFFSRRGELDWSHMAREVEKLQHLFSDRYVVQLLGVGWEADPPYYVMEYMPYGSLEDRLRQGPMSVDAAVQIIRETTRGLVHAHDKGILHCDLKPSNIMLDQDDRPRLADFGQARLRHERAPSLGTLFYMAPEQADLTATPDARWDVYALGAILYRMVTGRLPYFSDEATGSLSSHGPIEDRLAFYRSALRQAPAPDLHRRTPGVDRALADIIDKCLAVDPQKRYRNAQSVLTALESRQAQRAQRSLILLGLLGPALVVVIMAVVAGLVFRRTLDATERQLIERTLESDQYAARTVAAHFSLGIEKRRRMLEQDAADPALRDRLSQQDQTTDGDEPIQQWLIERHAARNAEFTENTRASYWFVLDVRGRLRAISPRNDALLGKYFGFREYFHGLRKELPPTAPPPTPIQAWHRSNIFRSRPTNKPSVAFSTPIFSGESSHRVVGILAMETELGHFSDFESSRTQFPVLIDLRPDADDMPGLIVEHPFFAEQLAANRPLEQVYCPPVLLEELQKINASRLAALSQSAEPIRGRDSIAKFEHYRDPIGNHFGGDWLAAVEPVFVAKGSAAVEDTDWIVVVQERRDETLRPLADIGVLVRRSGWVALTLAGLVVAALWAIVVLAINPPKSLRRSRLLGFATGGTSASGASASGTSLSSRSNDPSSSQSSSR